MSTASEIQVIVEAIGAEATVSQLQQVQQEQQKLKQGSADAGEGVGELTGMIDDMPIALAAVAMAVTAVVTVWGELMELSEEGAQIGRVFESGALAAQAYGQEMGDILSVLREVSGGMVSDLDLVQSASKALLLGVGADADQLGQLLEIAAIRGRMMGVDTTKSFNDIVVGLGRASPRILDNLGIVIDTQSAYKTYADSIGKAANELTKAEKTQAVLNATLKEAQPLLAATGGLAIDNAGQWERMHAEKKNYFDTLKMDLAEATVWWAEFWGDVWESANKERTEINLVGDLWEQAEELGLISDELQQAYSKIVMGFQDENGIVHQGQGEVEFFKQYREVILSFADAIEEANESTEIGLTGTQKWADSNYEGEAAVEAATTALEEQAKMLVEVKKLQEELADVTSLSTNFKGMISLAEDFDDILTQITEQETIMANNPIGSDKYDEAKEKVDSLKQSMTDLANQVVLDMLAATIAVGGVTEAEAAAYFDLAVDMGKISREAADAAIAAYGDAIAYINSLEIDPKTGIITFEVDSSEPDDYQPKPKRLLVETYLETGKVDGWQPPTKYGEVVYSPVGYNPSIDQTNALGGPVYPGEVYLVGERGPEPFIPTVPGTIMTNSDYSALLGGGTNSTLEIDYRRLGKVITDSLIEAAEEGRLGGNTVVVNSNGQRESVASNYNLLRAYGGNI